MSFLGLGQPKMSSAQKIAAAEQELEMVTDMFNRYACQESEREGRVLTIANSLSQSCSKKCIPPSYAEGELTKGESVCLDRCVSKFFDINVKVPSSFLLRGPSQLPEPIVSAPVC
jgi:import inner membrane translocase subunit TIM10